MPKSANDVIKLAKETGAKIVDLRFIDLPGMWQHFFIEDLVHHEHAAGRTRWSG